MKKFLLAITVLSACLALAAIAYADDKPAEVSKKAAEHAEKGEKGEMREKAEHAAHGMSEDGAKKGAAINDKAIAAIDAQIAAAKVNKKNPSWKTSLTAPKAVTFNAAKKYFVRMTTNKGVVLIRFMPDVAPMHVTNFIYLTRLGFYDGLTFHRVIPKFMAQGGDPLGNGMGGPGYGFNGEFSDKAKHDHPGMLSMANAGPGTDGSQFFLTFIATPWLDGKHTVFGEVVEGLDVLKQLEAAGTPGSGAPTERLTLDKAVVEVR